MPVLQAQSVSGEETTQLGVTVPGCTAGSRLVVTTAVWAVGGISAPLTVSSSPALSWSEDVVGPFAQLGEPDQGQQASIWSAQVSSVGSYAIQADFNAVAWGKLVALEVSGLVASAALDRTASNSANNASDLTPTVGPTSTLSQADEIVVAVLGGSTGSGSTADISADLASGWTRAFYDGDANTSGAIAVDHRTVSATTAVTGDWGTVATHCDAWSAALATYKLASTVGPPIDIAGGIATVTISTLGGEVSLGAPPPASVTVPTAAFNVTASFVSSVTVSTETGRILREDGGLVLREDNSFFLRESASAASTTAPAAFFSVQAALAAALPTVSSVFVTVPARSFSVVATFAPVPPGSQVPAFPSPALLAAQASLQALTPIAVAVPLVPLVLPGPAHHLRYLRVAAGSRLLAASPPNAVPMSNPLEPSYAGAVETFYDDFTGLALDGRKWGEVFSGAGENFVFDRAMLSVSNGLVIRTRWDGEGWRTGGIRRGTSATSFAGFRYGQVSVKARVDPGRGYGPVFALWPTASGGAAGAEIDALLAPGAGKTSGWNRVRGANGVTQDQAEFSADLGQWHVHTVRWEPGTVSFYLDGVPLRTVTSVAVDVPMALMLQGFVAAAGNAFYGGAPNEFSEKRIEIAYVRVSQLPGGPAPPDNTPRVLSMEPAGPGVLSEQTAGAGVAVPLLVKSTGISSLTYVVVRSDGTWREPRTTAATGGEVTITPRFFAVGDFARAHKADDFGVFLDSTAVASFTSPLDPPDQPPTGTFFEDFNGSWTGLLAYVWGETSKASVSGGTLHLSGSFNGVGAMSSVPRANNRTGGFGNGLFECRAKLLGGNVGDNLGPELVLWPADDRRTARDVENSGGTFPYHLSREVVVGALAGDGRTYMASHWTTPTPTNTAGTYNNWLYAVGTRESTNRYTFVAPAPREFLGYWQFSEVLLQQLGVYNADGTNAIDWIGSFTGKYGVTSKAALLASPDAQQRIMADAMTWDWNDLIQYGATSWIGKTVSGVKVTESGLLAITSLLGRPGAEAWLNNPVLDGNGTLTRTYLQALGGFDVSPVILRRTINDPTNFNLAPAQGTTQNQTLDITYDAFARYLAAIDHDEEEWHTYAVFLQTSKSTFYIDGVEIASETAHPSPDTAHGGINHVISVRNRSSNTALDVDFARWISEADVLARGGPYPVVSQPVSGRTLIGAHTGAWKVDAEALDQWMQQPLDGFLAYTAGWQGWDGLRPEAALGDPTLLGGTGRRLLWSIMMIPDGSVEESVGWYQEVASGARNGLFEQMGQELYAYHNSIGDTGPIYVRSTWEVPGEWFNWNAAAVEDSNAFRAAWAQFATTIRAGRPRIKTVWDFNSDRGPIEYLYPGDAYVDVISQDIYWIHDLQGTDPVAAFHRSRAYEADGGYSRGLNWHLDWCRSKNKPLAISEFGVKLNDGGENLDYITWFREFFAFVDECNQPGNPGMAYVTWWDDDSANVGKFTTRASPTQQAAVRNLFRARLLGTPG